MKKSISWLKQSSWKVKVFLLILLLFTGFFIAKKIFFKADSGSIFDTAQNRDLTEVVSESGTITANGSINIFSPTTGVVGNVFVANGQSVTERQKLFSVKSTATPQEKAAAYAAYQVAVTAVQQAENTRRGTQATVARIHDDLKNKGASENFSEKETRTTAEVTNDNAWDALLAARAQLASAQVAYYASQNSTVTAPISGLVSNLAIASGSSVLANNPLVPSSPALIISGLGITQVMISVGENDINKVKVGQTAQITLDAVNDRTYHGLVDRVDTNGTITQSVVKFNVYIRVTDSDDQLRPGMTADVDIITRQQTDVLTVPNAAVKPYQKGRAVRKLNTKGEIEYLPVKIGIRGKEYTQIIEGLEESQKVIVSLANEKTPKKNSPFGF